MSIRTLNFVEPTDVNISGVWAMDSFLLMSNEPAVNGDMTVSYKGLIRDLTSPTYRDLWVAASELITESKDEMHVFIEDFVYNTDENVWILVTGS